jgi:hypothetical protein
MSINNPVSTTPANHKTILKSGVALHAKYKLSEKYSFPELFTSMMSHDQECDTNSVSVDRLTHRNHNTSCGKQLDTQHFSISVQEKYS